MNFPHMVSFPGVFPFSREDIITPEERYLVKKYFILEFCIVSYCGQSKRKPTPPTNNLVRVLYVNSLEISQKVRLRSITPFYWFLLKPMTGAVDSCTVSLLSCISSCFVLFR